MHSPHSPQKICIGLKWMFIAQFFKASSLKNKIRPITLIVWVLGRVEKTQKRVRKIKKYFFCFKQIWKCDTCFSIHFSRAFQKYSFQVCSFSPKKGMAYFIFLSKDRTFSALYPTLCIKKKLTKILYSLKVTKFH